MPGWSPDWTDVRFDHASAEEVVTRLRVAATLLDQAAGIRATGSRQAVVEWRGPARETYDVDLARLLATARDVYEALLRAVRTVQDAADAARHEQAARVADRQRWFAERDRERAAEAAEEARAAAARLTATQSAGLPKSTASVATVPPVRPGARW